MILKLLGCYTHLGYYKVDVTGSIGDILIEINKRIEFYTCRVQRLLPSQKENLLDITWKICFLFYDEKLNSSIWFCRVLLVSVKRR